MMIVVFSMVIISFIISTSAAPATQDPIAFKSPSKSTPPEENSTVQNTPHGGGTAPSPDANVPLSNGNNPIAAAPVPQQPKPLPPPASPTDPDSGIKWMNSGLALPKDFDIPPLFELQPRQEANTLSDGDGD